MTKNPIGYEIFYILCQNMLLSDFNYIVNNKIFGHGTLITFYVECYKEFIYIKQLKYFCFKNDLDNATQG